MPSTSGTFNFFPSTGEIGLTAFARIGVKRTSITASHMAELRNAANLILSEWSNQTPNLWVVDLTTVPLVAGTATYDVAPEVVMILDLYISYGAPSVDRILSPISRSEFAAYPAKTVQGSPTVFWFDRLTSPTFTLWPVPDDSQTYTANYYSVRQTYDADLQGASSPEIPYRFLEAFTAGLAWKLAEVYNQALEDKMFARYQRAWGIASAQDVENVPIYITPGIGGYFDY
jgi:hypothetical protein